MVDIDAYGSQGDSGVVAASHIGRSVTDETIPSPEPALFPGTNLVAPHCFVGDEAFQLRRNIVRPYSRAQLDDAKRICNYRISRGRRIIENTFGILAARWRLLLKPIGLSPPSAEQAVKAAACLHNYLKMTDAANPPTCRYLPRSLVDYEDNEGRIQDGEWRALARNGTVLTPVRQMTSNAYSRQAACLRDQLKDYFLIGERFVPWQEPAALSC